MTNYEKLGFDGIAKWLARVDCENCLAQKYCYKRLPEDELIPCDEIIKKYLELDSIKGAEYFLTFKDIDEEDDDFDEETDDEFDDDFGEDEFEDTDMEGDDF